MNVSYGVGSEEEILLIFITAGYKIEIFQGKKFWTKCFCLKFFDKQIQLLFSMNIQLLLSKHDESGQIELMRFMNYLENQTGFNKATGSLNSNQVIDIIKIGLTTAFIFLLTYNLWA